VATLIDSATRNVRQTNLDNWYTLIQSLTESFRRREGIRVTEDSGSWPVYDSRSGRLVPDDHAGVEVLMGRHNNPFRTYEAAMESGLCITHVGPVWLPMPWRRVRAVRRNDLET
jgi:hypothetical protein